MWAPGARRRATSPLTRLAQAQQLSEIVQKVNAREPVNALERKLLAAGGSFGGAKPKALIDIGGVQWVIKFFNNEPIDVPLVEHASMTLAQQAGITVAQTQVVPLVGEHALAVRRFDREGAQRIHCISAGTALRAQTVAGQEPDLGYPALAQLLRRAGVADDGQNQRDMHELFRRMVFNILIDNTDDHEKNHALVLDAAQRYWLAPAFDVLPYGQALGYQQMRVGRDGAVSTLANALSEHRSFVFTLPRAQQVVAEVANVVNGWQAHFKKAGVSKQDLGLVRQHIDRAFLREQREAALAK